MKRYLIFALASVLFCACNQNQPDFPSGAGTTPSGGGGNQGGGTAHEVKMSFSYSQTGAYTYSFTNTSSGATSYKWDFGDGEYATTKDAAHKYTKSGEYTVTLTGTDNGEKYDTRAKISVKDPQVYIAGYVLYAIPYEDKYYKVICKDDDWFGTEWGFETVYTPLLDASDIPYRKYFNTPLLMDKLDGDNYYTFQLMYSGSTSGSGTQCLKKQLQKAEILKYKDEHILTSDNGQTKLGILMEYK